MAYDYSENILVQESAGNLLHDELGWDVVFAYDKEVLGESGTLGRLSYKDIILKRYLRDALKRLNPWITEDNITTVISALEEHSSTQTAMQINEEKYFMIRDGIKVKRTSLNGQEEEATVKLIDFSNPDNNSFLAVKELKIDGQIYHRRTDIVGFVNGLPLLFVELKRQDVDVENAYTNNYTDYQSTIPQLFFYNAFLMLSNGLQAKIGTLGSKYKFFHEWKRLKEDDPGAVDLQTMLRGVCKKEYFLDLFENFILFDSSNGGTTKILARNHQYLGVNEAFEAYNNRRFNNGKLGVFWHTQGSGKSYSMVFLAQKIRRKCEGSPTIVVLTDREELNDQISGTFFNCHLLGKAKKAEDMVASSGKDLIERLKKNPSFIFTLIQKFNKPDEKPIIPNYDILIISDEAHRTQNGVFADNMMHLLPSASRIGFTGTPLFSNDNITERTFGGYVSTYDFKRAVEDGATVPLIYENRAERIEDLKNPEINERILEAIEAADLDVEKQEKLEQEFASELYLLTAEKRLRIVAKDFVKHYSDVWQSGKAMMVCLNKVSCVRMYNYVQEYWQEAIHELELDIKKSVSEQEVQEMTRKLEWMKSTIMRVVISQEQNEISLFEKWGLDIAPHRQIMETYELDKEFKEKSNPFRVVFVCAMWLTGFDVKSLSCLYLDKPMKAHTLMQTIARANRVDDGKENGLILDYVGIVKALRNALAEYTANKNGNPGNVPTVDKSVLIGKINENLEIAEGILHENGFELDKLITAKDFEKLSLLKSGADCVSEPIEIRKKFCITISQLTSLWKYLDSDDITSAMKLRKDALVAIYGLLQKQRKHVDITDLAVAISAIINENIDVQETDQASTQLDISKINFARVRAEFAKEKNKKLLMKEIEELLQERMAKLADANPKRVDFFKRYQDIIDEYNREQDRASIEKTFEELLKLSEELNEEQTRYVREGFEDDEQLAVFDLLLQENLSKDDIKKVKSVSKELLAKVKELLNEFDHPFDKQETRANIEILIRDILWQDLPESYPAESINTYMNSVYGYVYQRYGQYA